MNIHKNARLTFARRIGMVGTIINQGLTRAAAAGTAGVCEATVRKWLGRYLIAGCFRPRSPPDHEFATHRVV